MTERIYSKNITQSKNHSVPTTTISSKDMNCRRRMIQNYLVIWFDSNIDPTNENSQKILKQLRHVINEVTVCNKLGQCIKLLTDMDDEKAFVILSGKLNEDIVSEIHNLSQVDAIYICSDNKKDNQVSSKEWPKIQGIFNSVQPICESLKKVARKCDHDKIPMSFVSKQMMTATASNQDDLNALEPSFMYSVLFKEILLEIDEDIAKSMETLIAYCRQQKISESELNEFQHQYHHKTPVWWYTCEIFLYSMLNRALRTLDMEVMIKIGFFIRNLHHQLEQLHDEQASTYEKTLTVYRGQGLIEQDFQHLLNTKGGLLSFNNFLSTSKAKKVATQFAYEALWKNENIIGVIFIMTVNPNTVSVSTTPFAIIDNYSAFKQEQEILFAMHTVFRVDEIKPSSKNNRIWEVELTLTGYNDPQLMALTNRLKQEINGVGWYRMGQLMIKVGHLKQAEELYHDLLNNTKNVDEKSHIYHMLGILKNNNGQYEEAASFYEKSLEIERSFLPENDLKLANTYNNIGLAHQHMGNHEKTLEFYEKARQIKEKCYSADHPELALTYSNIGSLYNSIGEYSRALELYQKALQIEQKVLPANHPNLGITYSNIGRVYSDMGNYSKSLEFCEKDLEITKRVLPSNHPDLAIAYGSIGQIYTKMGNFSRALSYLEKTLAIQEESLSPTHPHIEVTKHTIEYVKTHL